MSIVRVNKKREYVSIANAILQNKDLSWEARGIMAYLLSKPDGWECRNYDLVNQGPASEHVIRRVLKELQESGYIHRYRKSEGRGKIEWITEIYETPELNTALRNGTFSSIENIETESFDVEKSADIVSTDSQKILTSENTDINGSAAKNPQNQNGEDGFDRADQVERDNLNNLADQIAKTCNNINLSTAHPDTKKEIKRIAISFYKMNITPDDLIAFDVWWYDYTWQGKKRQPPTLKQLGDSWGQFEAQKVINVPITTDGGFYV